MEFQVKRIALILLIGLSSVAVPLCGWRAFGEPEPTPDQEAVWFHYYKARFNARYHDLAGSPELAARYRAVESKYKSLYDENATDVPQEKLDTLYLEMRAIEADENPLPKMDLIHRAQADVNKEMDQGTWP
jgi:hypothetical protein